MSPFYHKTHSIQFFQKVLKKKKHFFSFSGGEKYKFYHVFVNFGRNFWHIVLNVPIYLDWIQLRPNWMAFSTECFQSFLCEMCLFSYGWVKLLFARSTYYLVEYVLKNILLINRAHNSKNFPNVNFPALLKKELATIP